MKNTWFLLICFLSLIIFASCSTTSGQVFDENKSVYLTDDHIVRILPTDIFEGTREIQQLINGDFNGQNYLMQAIMVLNENELSVSTFSTMGNSIYEFEYKNDVITYESILEVSENSALYMVADIQFCYYPVNKVQEMIELSGLELIWEEIDGGWIRKIMNGKNEIITIKRQGNKIEYKNLVRNYNYMVEEL